MVNRPAIWHWAGHHGGPESSFFLETRAVAEHRRVRSLQMGKPRFMAVAVAEQHAAATPSVHEARVGEDSRRDMERRPAAKVGRRPDQRSGPFCININISDPHKPFYSGPGDKNQPSKVFKAAEVPIPDFLFDHPAVRKELAQYYSSVRRADDCVGKILQALDERGSRKTPS